MWQFIKDFHNYRPSEKRAILVLITLIVATILATIAYEQNHTSESSPIVETELQAFADSIQQADSLARARRAYYQNRQTSDRQSYNNKPRNNYTPRQPKDKSEVKHRDTIKLYRMDSLPRYEVIEKYEAGTLVDLNKADTTELKKIPGIGSAIARMIVAYRNQLGGFYQVAQLREINLDDEQLVSWFFIDEADIRKIPVNKSSVDRLRKHPYINFYQAKALVEHRRKHGDLESLKAFVLYEEFTEEDLERIGHYLSFE